MNIGERNIALGKYLKGKTYDSSSDFVVDYFKFDGTPESKTYLAAIVENSLRIYDVSEQNVLKFRDLVACMSRNSLQELYNSYNAIMSDFCDNHEIYKRFKLDEEDEEGWKIYKELSSKTCMLYNTLQFSKFRN
jgi:hypothetical protein